jgi:hypothetical protein
VALLINYMYHVKEIESFLVLLDNFQVNALGHYIHTSVEVKTGM